MDLDEGVDFIMVKFVFFYLDIIRECRDKFNVFFVVYNVSGEYVMVKVVGKFGFIDEERVMMEILILIKRVGVDIIIIYYVLEVLKILKR